MYYFVLIWNDMNVKSFSVSKYLKMVLSPAFTVKLFGVLKEKDHSALRPIYSNGPKNIYSVKFIN